MTDLNAPLDPTERDALAWRMLVERLEMAEYDLPALKDASHSSDMTYFERSVFSAVHDALAYRRQT